MPTGMRSSLIALALCTGFGAAWAAGSPGGDKPSTWSDPPARTEAAKPAEPTTKPPLPAAASAAQQKDRTAERATPRRERRAERRKTRRIVKAPPVAPRHHYAARRAPPMAGTAPGGPRVLYRDYPAYSAATYPPDYDDERLDRLSTAVPSGYLVMRRRTVEYPDGRILRIYRPAQDGADD
jgi:hypothetical protein